MFGRKSKTSKTMTSKTAAGSHGAVATDESDELRQRLTPEQYRVTQKSGTERPYSGQYWDTKADGVYHCVVCGEALFDSDSKFDSGTGWPSFSGEIASGKVNRVVDRSMLMRRIEARCANCDAHLGHVFPDGPTPTGERYCMNSASLNLAAASDDDPR